MVAVQPCPICRAPVLLAGEAASPHRPFCSRRCKLLDIGAWVDGDYRISRELAPEDLDGSLTLPDQTSR
jgi:uncharacterized protein